MSTSPTLHYSRCPVCSSSLLPGLSLKDYSVTQQDFALAKCPQCLFQLTQDMPDQAAIAPFYRSVDYISHTNTSKGVINFLYQQVRKLTLVQKQKLIERVTGLKKGVLVDIGSGTGAFAHQMASQGWTVSGYEPDTDARKLAHQLYQINLQPSDQWLQIAPASVEVITLWHVLEHVHDLQGYFQHFQKILQKGGYLIIAVPNYTAHDASAYGQYWAAYDVPRHLWHFSPASMEKLLSQNGFTLQAVKPMWFDSFYVSLLSSKYQSGRVKYLSALGHALYSNLLALRDTRKCSSVMYIARK